MQGNGPYLNWRGPAFGSVTIANGPPNARKATTASRLTVATPIANPPASRTPPQLRCKAMTKVYLLQVKMDETTREKVSPPAFAHNIGYAVQNVVDRMTEGPRPTVAIIDLEASAERIAELATILADLPHVKA
jgi:hypothetical protein